jgi:hypothetical protein
LGLPASGHTEKVDLSALGPVERGFRERERAAPAADDRDEFEPGDHVQRIGADGSPEVVEASVILERILFTL